MMNCQQFIDLATDFLDQRLQWRRRLEALVHLAICKGCRAYLEQLRVTIAAMKAVPTPAPADPDDALMRAFRQQHRDQD